MPRTKKEEYCPDVCPRCGLRETVAYTISKGIVVALIKIYNKAEEKRLKGELPIVNTRKEAGLTIGEISNLHILGFYGFIKEVSTANVEVTQEAIDFLKGKECYKTIIVKKESHGQFIDWFRPDGVTNIKQLMKKDAPYWENQFIKYSSIIKTEKDLEIAKQN